MAYDLLRLLPEDDREAHGQELVESALAINPYNFLLADAGAQVATTPQARTHFWETFKKAVAGAAGKPGGPTSNSYLETVENNLFKSSTKPSANKSMAAR
jgi:hypothetical protein